MTPNFPNFEPPNLNDPRNLNPSVSPKDIQKPQANPYTQKFPDGTKVMTPEEKEKAIQEWSKNPQVRNNRITAVDLDKFKPVDLSKYKWVKTLAYIGIGAVLLIAIALLMIGYTAWKDGTLLDPTNIDIGDMICGNVTIEEGAFMCDCPDNICEVACDCPTFPEDLNIDLTGGLIVENENTT